MPKKQVKNSPKISQKPKAWWDKSNLVEVVDEKGRTVQTLFPEVAEAKKAAFGTDSFPVARCIMFIASKRDLEFYEMYPPKQKKSDGF